MAIDRGRWKGGKGMKMIIDSVLTLQDGSWRFLLMSAVCTKPAVAYVHSQKCPF